MQHHRPEPAPLLHPLHPRAASQLKACPVCDTINARQNGECFVCGWAGRFDTNRMVIEQGLARMAEQFPELSEFLILDAPRPTLRNRIRAFFARFRRRIDLHA